MLCVVMSPVPLHTTVDFKLQPQYSRAFKIGMMCGEHGMPFNYICSCLTTCHKSPLHHEYIAANSISDD